MTRAKTWLGVLLGLVLAGAAAADPITIGQSESLWSELLEEERPYSIALPAGYSSPQTRYPVVYLLGGGDLFHYSTGVLRMLAHEDLVPPMIVVGIHHTARTRDLATPWSSSDPPPHLKRFASRAGGADRFLEFLTTELAPHIEQNYRTAPFRVLVGRSLAGFFALHTLFTSPDAFDGYLAISPSTHWDDGVVVREAEAYLGAEPEAAPKFLFLSLADEGGESREHYRRLVERLGYDAPANLNWAHREFVEDDHGSTFLPGLHRGLRTVFDGWRTPPHLQELGLEGFDRHFARLSKRYGFEIPVPEPTINLLGLRALAMGDTAGGLQILTQNTERYPESAQARYRLGTALEGDGQPEKAREHFERAVALGTASDDPNLATYQERLAALLATQEARDNPNQP